MVPDMISQTVKYALRILGYLADHPGVRVQGSQIASDTGIPANYLSKILNQLRKKGLVSSRKGWGGGFILSEKAGRASIGQVIDLFEGEASTEVCVFEMRQCDAKNPCPLHDHWERIQKDYLRMLEETTISDLRSVK
jgi:Rrf2 family iron-sulfur cluster assembly transcriptional regulator